MTPRAIFIRAETLPNEFRTPLIPVDIPHFIKKGIAVFVESSPHRVHTDQEYESHGAIVTSKKWHEMNSKNNTLIIGIKHLDDLHLLSKHTHCYFSHSFKGQVGAENILQSFRESSSILYDFEYFLSHEKRIITFSYFAGLVGCFLGLIHCQRKKEGGKIGHLTPYKDIFELFQKIDQEEKLLSNPPSIAIIGNGSCARGVKFILNIYGISYTTLRRDDTKDIHTLKKYDILYNCIKLEEDNKECFINENDALEIDKHFTLVDISCDSNKPNHPFPIYQQDTTWEHPVFTYNPFIDVIAVSNLPSLLPKESSSHFSSHLVDLFFREEYRESWDRCYQIFMDKIELL